MDEDNQEKLEKEANELDKIMVFIFGSKNNRMYNDLKQMSVYNNEKYLQIIEAACNIYQTQYEKRSRNNNQKGNNNSQKDDDEDNGDKKQELISAHLTMENKDSDDSDNKDDVSNDNSNKDGFVGVHVINNATNMLAIKGSWEPFADDGVESLMAQEDLICCHLTTKLFYESDDEEFSVLDEINLAEHVHHQAFKLYVVIIILWPV